MKTNNDAKTSAASDKNDLATKHQLKTHDEPAEREMPCPVCGTPMPDLKGGKATICPVCGFKDSCCY